MTNKGGQKILRIDLNLSSPAFRQIADALRALLVNGTYKPGDQVPTLRQVANDLGVHHNTVAHSYHILADEGWLELRRHHGAVVTKQRVPKSLTASQNFIQRLRELATSAVENDMDAKTILSKMDALANKRS